MQKKFFMIVAVMIAVVAASCGKKADQASVPAPTGGKFYYSTFAEGKIAADASSKAMLLDFYTDW